MGHDMKGVYRLGGIGFITSGALFLVRYLLDLVAGPPPSSGTDILVWVHAGKTSLAFGNEALFFATMSLIPGVVALYHSLARFEQTKAVIGCGIIAAAVPVLAMLDIVHGRLVYPVYGLQVSTPAVAELVVAVFYGGLHAAGILLGVATIVLSLAMMHGVYGRGIAYLGFAAGVGDFIGAYPDAIGLLVMLVCQILFAAWFVALGVALGRMASRQDPILSSGRFSDGA